MVNNYDRVLFNKQPTNEELSHAGAPWSTQPRNFTNDEDEQHRMKSWSFDEHEMAIWIRHNKSHKSDKINQNSLEEIENTYWRKTQRQTRKLMTGGVFFLAEAILLPVAVVVDGVNPRLVTFGRPTLHVFSYLCCLFLFGFWLWIGQASQSQNLYVVYSARSSNECINVQAWRIWEAKKQIKPAIMRAVTKKPHKPKYPGSWTLLLSCVCRLLLTFPLLPTKQHDHRS